MSIGPLYENESEKSFLAHLLLKGATGGTEFGVVPEDFFNDLHKRIFTSILEITDSNIPIDPLSVTNNLREKGRFKDESKESSSGIGMKNVLRRLELLYPGKHHIDVTNTGEIFRVVLEISLHQTK
jgi:replicative DNA helicase